MVFTGLYVKVIFKGGDTPLKRSKIESHIHDTRQCRIIVDLEKLPVRGSSKPQKVAVVTRIGRHAKIKLTVTLKSLILIFCLILFFFICRSCHIVPISLYISTEIVKIIQASLISPDVRQNIIRSL